MGREGKVASPALRGNANPRLLRHKLVFTTLRKYVTTQSSQNCIPAGRRAGLWSRADFPPARARGWARPAPCPGPLGATGPGAPGTDQRQQVAIRRSCHSQPHGGAASGARGGTRGRGGGRARTPGGGRRRPPSGPDEGLPDRYEPPAGRLHFTDPGRPGSWAGCPAGLGRRESGGPVAWAASHSPRDAARWDGRRATRRAMPPGGMGGEPLAARCRPAARSGLQVDGATP
jgi:hypothetical protein